MSLLHIPQPKSKIPLSPEQKKFKTLSTKVETLQSSLGKTEKKFEEWLMFYYREVLPMQKAFASALASQVKVLYAHYNEPKGLTRDQKRILIAMILEKIQVIINYSSLIPRDEEIMAIYEEFTKPKQDPLPEELEEFEDFKASTKKMFEKEGIDVDVDDMKITDDIDDFMDRVFESLDEEQIEKFTKGREAPRKKTKKEKEEERKLKEFQEMQRKGIRSIYKDLARLLHPDLETDLAMKETKMKLMKELTSAYEANDLFTLLQLERKWGNKSNQKTIYSEEQLKIFNTLLNNQLESLHMQQYQIIAHPRFSPLHNFEISPHSDGEKVLARIKLDYKKYIASLKTEVEHLQGKNGIKVLKERLKAQSYNFF